jgi:catechol 2,3-dioxygenase-like lactoylglutathione lyase family enzyme
MNPRPRLQHVSITIPFGREAEARAFYSGLLDLEERDVLPALDPRRFIWFRLGDPDLELHLMLTDTPSRGDHHLCLEVGPRLEELRAALEAAGVASRDATPIRGRKRFFCRDPFGNLIELTRIDDGGSPA